MNTVTYKDNEGTLIRIVRALPSNPVEQLLDSACFHN